MTLNHDFVVKKKRNREICVSELIEKTIRARQLIEKKFAHELKFIVTSRVILIACENKKLGKFTSSMRVRVT